ncbi:hypothetical protein PRSY57_0023000 [Plasmodium reichenowi]|uniref:Uncharacterized protein n=1 Tax=Plasmodium reichenowi TaxID=5854 RepID=A0A151L274_PLARE|nr:hypothetical protein PRSY57_0023000 [Plasmodium reichenowi]KYN93065.1 hypothetical protein PRSY57_0023000 [Plasmodium reichenowi]
MASTTLKDSKSGEKENEKKSSTNDIKYDITNDENYKKLKEDKKRLKKELLYKENEISNLKKILDDRDKETKTNYIPLNEARKITYKALRKGSAAQLFINLIESNNINYKLKKEALNNLITNAFGVMRHEKKDRYSEIFKYTDSHLKLFRQEQLILLAENERLTIQLKDLKKQLLDNKIEYMKKNERNLITCMKRNAKDNNRIFNKYNNIDSNYTIYNNNNNNDDDDYVELDADIVEKNFNNFIKNIKIAQLKLLYYAFRKLSNNLCYNYDPLNNNTSMLYSLKQGIEKLNNIIKYKINKKISNIFYMLLFYNSNHFIYNRMKNKQYSRNNKKDHMIFSHHINEYSSNSNYPNLNKNNNQGISNYVFKPYYYDTLPSASYDNRNKKIYNKNEGYNYNNKYNNYNNIESSMYKFKKDCIIRDINYKDRFYFEPILYNNERDINNHMNKTNNRNHTNVHTNSYIDSAIQNKKENTQKHTYSSDFDFINDFNSYSKEKFIDMFITETNKT